MFSLYKHKPFSFLIWHFKLNHEVDQTNTKILCVIFFIKSSQGNYMLFHMWALPISQGLWYTFPGVIHHSCSRAAGNHWSGRKGMIISFSLKDKCSLFQLSQRGCRGTRRQRRNSQGFGGGHAWGHLLPSPSSSTLNHLRHLKEGAQFLQPQFPWFLNREDSNHHPTSLLWGLNKMCKLVYETAHTARLFYMRGYVECLMSSSILHNDPLR